MFGCPTHPLANPICRSNFHNVFADLIRDVTRRLKIELALEAAERRSVELPDLEAGAGDADDTVAPMADDGVASDVLGPFPIAAGVVTLVAEVSDQLLLTKSSVPFTKPVPFADRLGLFLTDGEAMPPGTYPGPDDGVVVVYPSCKLTPESGPTVRVHARPDFYGKPAYSFVELIGPDATPWFAQVWLLFSCLGEGEPYDLALVSYLRSISPAPYHTRKATVTWHSRHVDCVEVANIRRVVQLVRTVCEGGGLNSNVFHLLA